MTSIYTVGRGAAAAAVTSIYTVGRGAAIILALFRLRDRERYIVIQRHLRGRTLDDVAAELGTSRQRVSQIEQRGLRRLAGHLAPIREDLAA